MTTRTFNYCALQFLNQWLEKEAGYCQAITSEDIEVRRQGLRDAAGHFRIARNFPTKHEDAGRFQAVLDALNNINETTSTNVIDIVANLQEQLSQAYGGRNVLSAATKFLWLKLKAPVRIYDAQARRALGTADNDYGAFCAAFTAKYAKVRGEIEKATASLASVISYTAAPDMTTQKLETLVSNDWFKERVLDIYLWNTGNVKPRATRRIA